MSDQLSNTRWPAERLHETREKVFAEQLGQAPYDLDEALAYAVSNARRGTVSGVLAEAKRTGRNRVCS